MVYQIKNSKLIIGSFSYYKLEGLQPPCFAGAQSQDDPAEVNPLVVIEKIQACLLLGPRWFGFLNLGGQIPRFVVNQDVRGSVGRHVVNYPCGWPGSGRGINKAGVIRRKVEGLDWRYGEKKRN